MSAPRWTPYRVSAAYAGLVAVLNGAAGAPSFGAAWLLVALVVLAIEAAPKRRRTDVPLLTLEQRRTMLYRAMVSPQTPVCPLCHGDLRGQFAHFVDLYDAGTWMCRPCASLFYTPTSHQERAA